MNDYKPTVTVIVLIYNDPVYGKRAIESALNQTYQNVEVKILDNGSTDESVAMIDAFRNHPKAKIVRNPINQRSEFATRIALETKTDLITFLFSDDYYEPQRIEVMVSALLKDPSASVVFSNNLFVDEKFKPLAKIPATQFDGSITELTKFEHLRHMLQYGNSLHPCAMLIRSETYRNHGGFKGFLHRIGDMTFFASILGSENVLFINDTLQKITVWNTGRNESNKNNSDFLGVIYERSLFLNAFFNPNYLKNIEKIFPEVRKVKFSNHSESECGFLMGYLISRIPAPDYVSFGAYKMFESYEANPSGIERLCQEIFKCSFAQLSYRSSKYNDSTPTSMKLLIKTRLFLKEFPLLKKWYVSLFKRNSKDCYENALWGDNA